MKRSVAILAGIGSVAFGLVMGWLANAISLNGVLVGIVAGVLSFAYFVGEVQRGMRGEKRPRRGRSWFFFWWS